ncbi:PAS domain S-box-containing protein/diguanylate cyclase (GGDEF) domain-containing protein [Blastococcus haudaquaticus]|uniref:PAS domain S-box-containing protein/diguanylate cyclase (GGDEF) domain-containing protein n=1 Tax=Blastococcus haudaquaticus TaxID=1938745 RepID=A0A286GZF3_9ACTN|nr:PAS domain S-box-containing protein/diguanylate cyclase (GGDEF) domain-containing protein [Blastococcus haudaquaticus]
MGVFTRLALGMAALGICIGAVFPYFAEFLDVPTQYSRASTFRMACLAAGVGLGAANWLLARRVIGRRLQLLATRLTDVADTVGSRSGSSGIARAELTLPVGAADDLGRTAAAFNAMLAALDRERRFRSVVQATSDVIMLIDLTGRISFVSDSVTDLLGRSPQELLGQRPHDLVHPDDPALLGLPTGAEFRAGAADLPDVLVVRVRHGDGNWRHLEVTSSDRRTDPVIGALLLTARDVTERIELQERLAHQATHDELTALPNRAAVLARGAELLAARQGGGHVAVALLDLDRFKEVNDTLGHGYGDRLLAQIGPRLRPHLREVDVVARLGGDEFLLLLPDVSTEAARAVAERARAALIEPFLVDGLALDVDVSIGVAVSGAGPLDIDSLLRQADIAMYTAKERQSGVEVYDAAADGHDRGRLVLLSEFRRGMAEGHLVLHYQPKVSLRTGAVVGLEALVRWEHPTRGLLLPGDFLPAVEQTGLIEPLTDCVLDLALAQVRAWTEQGVAVPVAVNLSARSVHRPDLPARVLSALASHGIPAGMLRLELTESALVAEPARARDVLGRLHSAGVSLSIDDFGTGYSSMGRVKNLPVSEVKIDRSFIAEMATTTEDAALVRSVVDLGHELGLTVVAEGVEDPATAAALAELGCDVGQGYLYAAPMGAAEMTDWLAGRLPAAVTARA